MPELGLQLLAVCVAVFIDMHWGEPPARFHPVVWMGRYLNWAAGPSLPTRILHQWVFGTVYWLVGAVGVVGLAVLLEWGVYALPVEGAWLGLALVFKPHFAWGLLRDEVRAVEHALGESLDAGRKRVSYLCSRDVSQLSEHQVRETAIETLAENLNDSFIAPVLWFVVLGLPGVCLYRFANTADAMWGYMGMRNGRDWTWFGQCAARVDDVLSWLPARITAALLWAVSGGKVSVKALWHEARKPTSPNSGWPMAAMALALTVRLEKPNVYVLNPTGRAPQCTDTDRALRMASRVVYGVVGGCFLCCVLVGVQTR